jgi:perosamine synthetase
MKVPLSEPWISRDDIKSITKALENKQLTDGPLLRKFETKFSKAVNSKFAVAVSNGTESLHLSLVALEIGKGDEVIIPDMTFVATANAVILTGAKPILVDIDNTLNISTSEIEKKITKKTKAIIPVHFAGISSDIENILKIARKNNLAVIEDSAHAFGTYFNKKHVGTFGNTGCFSFYPTKNITTIEGGMITTNSKKIAKKLQLLRNHGLTKTLLERDKTSFPWEYDIFEPGYNFRLDEIRAALGISQISRFKNMRTKRIKAAKYYNKKLDKIDGIEIVNRNKENCHAYHLYIIRILKSFGMSRNSLHKKLFKAGIKTTVHYKPLHKFSYFKKYNYSDKSFPNTLNMFNECLTLPLYTMITKKQQDYVIETIQKEKK